MHRSSRRTYPILTMSIGSLLALCLHCVYSQTPLSPQPADGSLKAVDATFPYYDAPFGIEFLETAPGTITGAPYSAVGTTQSVIRQPYGGRIVEGELVTRFYRDGQGRTRAEAVLHPRLTEQYLEVAINDPVRRERYSFNTVDPSAFVQPLAKEPGARTRAPVDPPPPIQFELRKFLLNWSWQDTTPVGAPASKTVQLGEKVIDGVRTIGRRLEHTVPGVGRRLEPFLPGEQPKVTYLSQPITATSEEWFSPELGVVVQCTLTINVPPSAGIERTYRLEQIVRGEPDPALFTAPPRPASGQVGIVNQSPSPNGDAKVSSPEVSGEDRIYIYEESQFQASERNAPETVAGAPYSSIAITESVAILGPLSGRPIVNREVVRYFRDSKGRVRAEPETAPGVTPTINITDPVRRERYRLNTEDKSVDIRALPETAGGDGKRQVDPPRPVAVPVRRFLSGFEELRAPGPPVSHTIALGEKVINGLRAVGTRLEHTIPGKTQPIRVISEQWFSTELGVVVKRIWSLRLGPTLNMRATYRLDAVPGEPDAALFSVPADYAKREAAAGN